MAFSGVVYAPGARFRVTESGVSILGYLPRQRRNWTQPLPVGTVVTCTGFGRGSDTDHGVEFTCDAAEIAGAEHCIVTPVVGGPQNCHPEPGLLEAI